MAVSCPLLHRLLLLVVSLFGFLSYFISGRFCSDITESCDTPKGATAHQRFPDSFNSIWKERYHFIEQFFFLLPSPLIFLLLLLFFFICFFFFYFKCVRRKRKSFSPTKSRLSHHEATRRHGGGRASLSFFFFSSISFSPMSCLPVLFAHARVFLFEMNVFCIFQNFAVCKC